VATYYVRADGSSNKAGATSDAAANTSMSLATCISESSGFADDDVIVISDAGGVYRADWLIYGGGSSGHPITYQANSGGTPEVRGSDLVSGFSVDSGSRYKTAAVVTTEPEQVWVDGTFGDRKASAVACVNDFDWYWAADILYLYDSAGDPNDRSSPGIEIGQRDACMEVSQEYVDITGITFSHSNRHGASPYGASNMTFTDCVFEWNWINGFTAGSTAAYSGIVIQDCVGRYNGTAAISFTASGAGSIDSCSVLRSWIYENGKLQGDVDADHEWTSGIKFLSPTTNCIVAENEVYDNGIAESGSKKGHGIWFDFAPSSSGNENEISHNLIYDNQGCAVFLEVVSYCHVFGNVAYGNNPVSGGGDWRSATIRLDTREDNDADGIYICNNTFIGGYYGMVVTTTTTRGTGDIKNNVFKNNIVYGYSTAALYANLGGDNDGTYGSGNVYEQNCFGAESAGFIEWDGTAYDTYDTWISASSQTDNNIESDPTFTNSGNDDYSNAAGSPSIGAGANLGSPFNAGVLPASTWPDGVLTADRDDY